MLADLVSSAPLSRRRFLYGVGVAAAMAGAAACTSPSGTKSGPSGPRPLPIPPLLESRVEGGRRVFALTAQTGSADILPGRSTPIWGYNGTGPGPTLRARDGEKVRVDVANQLPDTTTVHWHGMHLPAEADGGPHQPIPAGKRWTAEWTVDQQAATLWYHPHPHGETGRQANRGLAGLFIIDDDTSDRVALPRDYGIDDIPLVIADRRFADDGTLDETDLPDVGLLGDTVVANGITEPVFTATTRRVRFRILDAATMRLFNLRFSDGRRFHIVASDGGLLDRPEAVDVAAISPGERIEIVVDLEPGETVVLQSVAFDDNLEVDDSDAPDFGLSDTFDILTIVGPALTAPVVGPLPMAMNPTLRTVPDTLGAKDRTFDMEWFQINGKQMDMTRVDDIVVRNDWERWVVHNKDNWIHNFHVHDTQFRVLDLENTSTTPQTSGWKDTILLAPGAKATLAVRFTDYTSTRWPYMYHCHLMYHEDQGMMGQFMVVDHAGQGPAQTIGAGAGMSHGMSTMDPSTMDDSRMVSREKGGSASSGK